MDGLMIPYSFDVQMDMITFFNSLREKDRRRYAAVEATKLGPEGVSYIAGLLGIDPKTIRQGQEDLRDLPDVPPHRDRKKGGGRKRKINSTPQLVENFHLVLQEHTAGSPEEELVWTDLTLTDIAERLSQQGTPVSYHIVLQLLEQEGFHQRQAQKSCAMGENPDRNDQFLTIARLKQEFFDSGNPILSIDTKKRELIGNFFRYGALWTRKTQRTFDHDFPSFADGVVIPHGLYDLRLNRGYIHLGTSHDTSEFACDCLRDWWPGFGQEDYPQATELLLLCDCGGSNSANTHLFKVDLQALVNEWGMAVRVAHYPAYCSKHNPIEHRLFCHVSRACRGVILKSVSLVKQLMEKARTRTGLQVVVEVLDKVYQKGRKVAEEAKESLNLVRDTFLPKWNYRILPQN